MSDPRDYYGQVCTSSRPPVYHQQGVLSSLAQGPTANGVSCGMEMRAREHGVRNSSIAAQLGHRMAHNGVSQQHESKSILFSILNGGSPSSLSEESSLEEKMDAETGSEHGQGGDSRVNQSSLDTQLPMLPTFVDPNAYRSRSDSFNSVGGHGPSDKGLSRTSSGGSLAGSISDLPAGTRHSEALVEATVKRLLGLSTDASDVAAGFDLDSSNRSRSHPGTPPTPLPYPEPRRKFSMGSRLQQMQPTICESVPVDLSCKRSRLSPMDNQESQDSTPMPYSGGNRSILESLLSKSTIRERSHTLAVCGTRELPPVMRTTRAATFSSHPRQRVTLAKKTVFPVSARVAEHLRRAVDFARSLPEFCSLPLDDQVSLLAGCLPRLLLLYMAEGHLQFAVTSSAFADDDRASPLWTSEAAQPNGNGADVPTMQFVDGIQNFIRKCQSLQISPNEYFYMRMIILFHAGSALNSLERAEDVDRVGAEARQDLQDFAKHNRPAERLRYSSLLLTLHTVFGVHCGMLATLFCRHVPGFVTAAGAAGTMDFAAYARMELSASSTAVTAGTCAAAAACV